MCKIYVLISNAIHYYSKRCYRVGITGSVARAGYISSMLVTACLALLHAYY